MKSFDYIIVGAGSAGCVLAARLTEDPSVSVCLLEAGKEDKSPLIHIPAGVIGLVTPLHSANYAFETVPQVGLNGRRGFSTARQGARRFQFDQCHDVLSRPSLGLRSLV